MPELKGHSEMLYRLTLLTQTIYYFGTAVWALVDINSFMAITGPKTDIWLVKTVAVLLLAICASFITALVKNNGTPPVTVLAIACCLGLLIIDCYYYFNEIISKIYLLDAFLEIILLALWLIVILRAINKKNSY